MSDFLFDIEDWHRVGRGKTFEFFATDEEVLHCLLGGLPADLQPYTIIALQMVRDGRIYKQDPIVFEIGDFCRQRDKGMWRFFIRSHVRTPDLDLSSSNQIDRLLSFNGMVNLQHGAMHHDKLTASCIGLVNKVGRNSGSEVVQHTEYQRVFDSLKQCLKRHLSFTAVYHFADGRKRETKTAAMSKGIVDRYLGGEVRLEAEPGDKV